MAGRDVTKLHRVCNRIVASLSKHNGSSTGPTTTAPAALHVVDYPVPAEHAAALRHMASEAAVVVNCIVVNAGGE